MEGIESTTTTTINEEKTIAEENTALFATAGITVCTEDLLQPTEDTTEEAHRGSAAKEEQYLQEV